MKNIRGRLLREVLVFSVIALPFVGDALGVSRLSTLYSFAGGDDGRGPVSTLIADKAGNLYGTTAGGGGASACGEGCGTIFMLIAPSTQGGIWTERILYRFSGGSSDGAAPQAGLIADAAGNLYGTTSGGGNQACDGGCGVVYELMRPTVPGAVWTEVVLHSFSGIDGAYPEARLTFDSTSNLYSTTLGGGAGTQCATGNVPGCGTIFELTPSAEQGQPWTYNLLFSFGVGTLATGVDPIADLIFNQSGNLYGTTEDGGANEIGGTVFELSPGTSGGMWTETVLYSFSGIYGGTGPHAGVAFDRSGNLYGTTFLVDTYGTLFQLQPSAGGQWTERDLFYFSGHATLPTGDLLLDSAGNVYGTASNDALFRLENNGGSWLESQINLYRNGGPVGPSAGLIIGRWGAIYGTTISGGGESKICGHLGCGTVFAVLQ